MYGKVRPVWLFLALRSLLQACHPDPKPYPKP